MTSKTSNQRVQIELRVLDSCPNKTWCNFSNGKGKPFKIMENQELLGQWKQAKIGDYVQVSILQTLAERLGVYDITTSLGTRPPHTPKNG